MADLSDIQAAQSVKIIGSDSLGSETTPVSSNGNGKLNTAEISAELRPELCRYLLMVGHKVVLLLEQLLLN